MNGGTCENGAPRAGFTCACPHGYSGDSCELEIRSSGCAALKTVGGVYTPVESCQWPGAAMPGHTCHLQCSHQNMVRVPSIPSEPSRMYSQLDLVQRRCNLDVLSGRLSWTGHEAACACMSGYFGPDCAVLVNASASMRSTIGVMGGDLEVAVGGHSVRIPDGAVVADTLRVSLDVFQVSALGEFFPPVPVGFKARSDLVQVTSSEGVVLLQKNMTVAISILHGMYVNMENLGLFYWDLFSSSWVSVHAQMIQTDGFKTMQGSCSRFSRWAVLERVCHSNFRLFSVNETTQICVPEHLYPSADVLRCSLQKTWKDIRADTQSSDATGRRITTGGLGRKMVKYEWEVWICYPDLTCGAPVGSDAVCFTFSERFRVFVPWGINNKLKLGWNL